MQEMVCTLSFLGEALEECWLYFLDPSKVKLQDQFIFTAQDRTTLFFTFVPIVEEIVDEKIDLSQKNEKLAQELEDLVVNWIRYVDKPDGDFIQQILQLLASKDFIPANLSDFTKRWLAYFESEKSNIKEILPTEVVEEKLSKALACKSVGEKTDNIPLEEPGLTPLSSLNQLSSTIKSSN